MVKDRRDGERTKRRGRQRIDGGGSENAMRLGNFAVLGLVMEERVTAAA
ncbi:hypothetical protein L195_g049327 [Trifolium pratense]|uniref:Uncharacterized protein n=1 Tax=Trifolium pratense TaxID=57577 RepID=A0A2K3JNT5_TRIPR|nr:hypothetical protein L195_g049327 [Trifolium pratense]